MTTTAARFQQNGYTAAYLTANNPTPANRELMFELDTQRFKIGDGATAWNQLGYMYGRLEAQADIAPVSAAATSALTTANAAKTGLANAIYYRPFNVMDFGAKGDGVTDDRAAIQAALDQAYSQWAGTGAVQEVCIPGFVFGVKAADFYNDNGSPSGAYSLKLPPNVRITGSGTIKVLPGAYGPNAYYAVIRCTDSGVYNAGIHGITIDGNRANMPASVQCNNIMLTARDNVEISATKHFNINGQAIMVTGQDALVATNIRVHHNYVSGANGIGIQVSRFNGVVISNNVVQNTNDNCIDLYGDLTTGTSIGNNFVVSNNVCNSGLVGIYPETVCNGTITGNTIYACSQSGIHLNRIHSEPNNVVIADNQIAATAIGVWVTGDTGGIVVRGNNVAGASIACVQLGSTSGNVSKVYVLDNVLNTATANATPLVLITGNQAANNRIRGTITSNTTRSWDAVFYQLATNTGNVTSAANAA